jgi:hypothetical protein
MIQISTISRFIHFLMGSFPFVYVYVCTHVCFTVYCLSSIKYYVKGFFEAQNEGISLSENSLLPLQDHVTNFITSCSLDHPKPGL